MTTQQIPPLLPCPNSPLQVPFSPPFGEINGQEFEQENSLPHPLSLSLIIPTYNEKPNIISLIAILNDLLAQTLPEDYELILVDDDSPDLTWAIAANLRTDDYALCAGKGKKDSPRQW
jgi:dolichol-phosphate mannosyltransferase